MQKTAMLLLHDNLGSGNAYKVRLMLSHLETPFKRIEYDVTLGETRTADFMALSPDGRVPLLEFPDGRLPAPVQRHFVLFVPRHRLPANGRLCPGPGSAMDVL